MSDAAGEVVAEEADSATISNNASSTRTTSTATTSHARHIPAMTTTTTRTESQANISARESGSSNEASDAKQSQPIPQRNGTDRPVLPADLSTLSPDQLQQVWDQQEAYIKSLEQQVVRLKEEGSKMKEQLLQATRRENILILRLTSKDKALLDLRVRRFTVFDKYDPKEILLTGEHGSDEEAGTSGCIGNGATEGTG